MGSRQLYSVTSFKMLTNYTEQEEISTGTSFVAKSTSKCSERKTWNQSSMALKNA